MINKRICLIGLLGLFLNLGLSAQVNPNSAESIKLLEQNAYKIEEAKTRIAKLGISEAEFTDKLKKKGYDLNNLSQSQLSTLETVVDETILELEEEKKGKVQKQNLDKNNTDKNKIDQEKEKTTISIDQYDYQPTTENDILENFGDDTSKTEIDSVLSDKDTRSKIFGQHYFKEANLKLFLNAEDVVPADDYVLGAGDNVRVVIFGRSIYDSNLEIDAQGYIDPTTMPKIYLKGITWGAAKKIIESRFHQQYAFNSDQIAVSLQKSKVITVSVFGEVNKPGSYTSPAVNTAFNLLVLAKGVSEHGSVRKIEIITPGGASRKFDVYKSFLTGESPVNIYLQTNDIIHVPVAGTVIQVKGAVNRPNYYELLANETIADAIKFSGGFAANAFQDILQVIRYENGSRKIIEINKSNTIGFKLINGDILTVLKSTEEILNKVNLSGEVEIESDFEWKEGIRVYEVIQKGKLKRTSKTDVAFIQRLNADNSYSLLTINLASVIANPASSENLLLLPNDKILILAKPDFTQYYKLYVSGSVRNPGEFEYDPNKNMKISDLIVLANGLKPEAIDKAYLIRTDSSNHSRSYVPFSLKNALNDSASIDNITLMPSDRIVVLSNNLINYESYVTINGAVQKPGKFKFGENMTLLDAVTLAGGFRMDAATNRIDVYRAILKNNEPASVVAASFELPRDLNLSGETLISHKLQPFDVISVRSIPQFELQKIVKLTGEVRFPGDYSLLDNNETIYSVIQRAGGLNPEAFPGGATLERLVDQTGLVIIELDEILKNPGVSANIALRAGDRLNIPKHNELVSIGGAVNIGDVINNIAPDKINVAYHKGMSAKTYILDYAGGFAKNADRNQVFVENSSGKRSKTKRFLFFRTYPKVEKGSSIYVASKEPVNNEANQREKTDWTKLIADSVAQATAILTLVVLINTINKN